MEIYRSPHSKKPQDQVVSSIFYWIQIYFKERNVKNLVSLYTNMSE